MKKFIGFSPHAITMVSLAKMESDMMVRRRSGEIITIEKDGSG